MEEAPGRSAESFRFSLRSLFFVVTCVGVAGGIVGIVPLIFLILAGVFGLQCLLLATIQHAARRIASRSSEAEPAVADDL